MIKKTSGVEFNQYGSTYDTPIENENLIRREITNSGRAISNMYYFSCEVYIELVEGIASILITEDVENGMINTFAIHRYLKLKPKQYFNILALGAELECYILIPHNYTLKTAFLAHTYVYQPIIAPLNIQEILGYYYVIKSPHYYFKGESHSHYELTYVDQGTLETTVDNKDYSLNNFDLIFYGPGQFHNQQVNTDKTCSYLTIIFDLDIEDNSGLLNQVFHCNQETHDILSKFIIECLKEEDYSKPLMLCYLQELIILLLQAQEKKCVDRQGRIGACFQNSLLQQIIGYLDDKISEPLTIDDVCQKFAISRTSLQALFNTNLGISPKSYIIQLKLKRAKELICENKYTISEITFMLGFSSIHYFSRTFKQHFGINPSDYAKKIYHD